MLSRRGALGIAAAALCAPSAPRQTLAQTRSAMLSRAIPKSNEQLPVIGLGTWQTFDVGADRSALDQRKQVLQTLFDAGGKVIDSSPMYGRRGGRRFPPCGDETAGEA